MSAQSNITASAESEAATAATTEAVAVAFGTSAAIVIVFNTLLAWIKDAYDPLNNLMASLTGHHWITHGLIDVVLFVLLGWLLSRRDNAHITYALVVALFAAAAAGGLGLAAWFLFV
jgi:hypothetical protein